MTEQHKPWVSVADVAKHIGVSKETVYRWVEGRGMPAHRVGRLMKFQLDEVDAWVRRGGADANGGDTAIKRWTSAARGQKWTFDGDASREAVLRRYGQTVVRVETARAAAEEDGFRGSLQSLLTHLLTVRSRLEITPQDRLTQLSTLTDLETVEQAVAAALGADDAIARMGCLQAARDALARILGEAMG